MTRRRWALVSYRLGRLMGYSLHRSLRLARWGFMYGPASEEWMAAHPETLDVPTPPTLHPDSDYITTQREAAGRQ